jgi:hypothetical protein
MVDAPPPPYLAHLHLSALHESYYWIWCIFKALNQNSKLIGYLGEKSANSIFFQNLCLCNSHRCFILN